MIFGVNTLHDISKWSREITIHTRDFLLRVYQRVHGYTSSSWIITEMNHPTWFTPCSWPLKGGTPGNLWWGCATQFSKSWPYFRPKNVIFHTRLLTRSLKSRPILAGWPYLACSMLSDSGGLPSFLPFYFRVRAFSIRRTQLSRGPEHEQARPD